MRLEGGTQRSAYVSIPQKYMKPLSMSTQRVQVRIHQVLRPQSALDIESTSRLKYII